MVAEEKNKKNMLSVRLSFESNAVEKTINNRGNRTLME